MHSFTDSEGRRWTFVVNVLAVRRVKQQTGIDLLALLDPEQAAFQKITEDPLAMIDVILAVLDDDLQRAGISDEDFLRALDNEQIMLDATRACVEAVINFSPKPKAATMRRAFGKVWDAMDNQTATQMDQARKIVESPEFDEMIEKQTARAMGQNPDEEPTAGKSSSVSPAASA